MTPRDPLDLTADWTAFLRGLGCHVSREGVATVDDAGRPHFDMWGVELSGRARVELDSKESWDAALCFLAEARNVAA